MCKVKWRNTSNVKKSINIERMLSRARFMKNTARGHVYVQAHVFVWLCPIQMHFTQK